MTSSVSDDPIVADILSYLHGVKCLYGSKQIPATLIRHPKIRDYLKSYLADKAIDIENTIVSLQSK